MYERRGKELIRNESLSFMRTPRTARGNYNGANMENADWLCHARADDEGRPAEGNLFPEEGNRSDIFFQPRKYSLEAGILAGGTFLARSRCH